MLKPRSLRIRTNRLVTLSVLVGLAGIGLALQVLHAQNQQKPEIGELDKQKAAQAFPSKLAYSPYAGRNYPARPYFGDTSILRSPWMPVHLVRASGPVTPIALHGVKR